LARAFAVVDGSLRPGIYRLDPAVSPGLEALCKEANRRVFIASGHADSKAHILEELARAFTFPSYFGHNWDALLDCVSDPSWAGEMDRGLILIWRNFSQPSDDMSNAKDRLTLLNVLDDAVDRWYSRGTSFHVLLTDPVKERFGFGSGLPYIERPYGWDESR
jgi:RNAse (barnase) inhibitor barstar